MKERDRIEQMVKAGKINRKQADMLLGAVEASRDRTCQLKEGMRLQKDRARGKLYNSISWLVIGAVFLFGILLALTSALAPSRGAQRAVADYDQAAAALKDERPADALHFISLALRDDANNPAAHLALAVGQYHAAGPEAAATHLKNLHQIIHSTQRSSSMPTILILILLSTLFIGGAYSVALIFGYNTLTHQTETIEESWANILATHQYQSELGAKLEAVCREASVHESEIIRNLVRSRTSVESAVSSASTAAETSQGVHEDLERGGEALDKALQEVRLLVEDAPELRSSENYRVLQDALARSQEQLLESRRKYNQAVRRLNQKARGFPYSLAAMLFQLKTCTYWSPSSVTQGA